MKKLFIVAAFATVAFAFAGSAHAQEYRRYTAGQPTMNTGTMGTEFKTSLRGTEMVPAVNTKTRANIRVVFFNDPNYGWFKITIYKGNDVVSGHLHCGRPGQNGPHVVNLFGDVPGGFDIDGYFIRQTLYNFNILPEAANCNPAIRSMPDLFNALRDGRIYAAVHTVANPRGEIRGQFAGN